MTEYRIRQENSIFKIYREGSGDELAFFSFSGPISRSMKSGNIKLSSKPFSRKKWKIKREKIKIGKIKFPGLFRKNLWIQLKDIKYEGTWFREKKYQIKSLDDGKMICSINKSKKSSPDHLVIEDPGHIEADIIYLLSVLIYSYYDKL